MTQKGRTTVWVDKVQAERIRDELGIDLSKLASQAMDMVESEMFGDIALELRVKLIDGIINSTSEDLGEARNRVTALQLRLKEAEEKKNTIFVKWQETKQSTILAGYMYQLNLIIVHGRYDPNAIREAAPKLLEDIKRLSPLFDLEAHIKGYRKDMGY
jgi:hypothetical protein